MNKQLNIKKQTYPDYYNKETKYKYNNRHKKDLKWFYLNDTCVTIRVKATYAATEREVIQAKVAPNLYASMPDTIAILKKNKQLRCEAHETNRKHSSTAVHRIKGLIL